MARWTTRRIAEAGQASVPQLQRAFRSLLGLAPRDYVAACRRRRFLEGLRGGKEVTRAVYEAGYGSPSRAYDAKRRGGVTPATYAKGGRGIAIDWLTVASPVGRILVAATDKGLCFVEVGRTLTVSASRAEGRIPPRDDRRAPGWAAAADGARGTRGRDGPYAARESPRRRARHRVSMACLAGARVDSTRGDDDLREAGAPDWRTDVHPCRRPSVRDESAGAHRAVPPRRRRRRSLRGYRWGVQVKDALLAAERQQG